MAITISGTDGITPLKSTNGTAAAPGVTGEDTDTGLFFETNTINISTGGTQRATVDSSGNLGVGLTAPAAKLHVSDTSGNPHVRLTGSGGSSDIYATSDIFLQPNSSTAMTLKNGGKVGIGTTAPASLLEVHSDTAAQEVLRVEGDYSSSGDVTLASFRRGGGAVAAAVQYHDALTAMSIGTTTNQAFTFRSNNVERMRLAAGGQLFIGSTGYTSANSVRINMSFTGGGAEYGMSMNAGSLNAGTKYITFDISTTQYGSIGWNGSAIQYYTTSDYRLKENIVSLEGAIERVIQLQPRRFNYTHNSDMTVDGFIAHEAQVAVPEAVSGTHDEVDDNGNPVYQNIDLSKFVPLLTAALKEAVAKIETLETKVAALEAAE